MTDDLKRHESAVCEMTCEECQDLLPLVADGVLDEQDDPSLFHHLARCQNCQAELAMLDRIGLELELAGSVEATPQPISFSQWAMRAGGLLTAAAMLLTGGWLTIKRPSNVGSAPAGSHSSTVLRVVDADDGQQGLLVRHADGSVEVVEELDQPRQALDAEKEEELRAASSAAPGATNQRNPWRPAIK